MNAVETVFATVVLLLASIACVGALLVAIAWEVAAFRRIRDRARKPTPEETFWRSQRALDGPGSGQAPGAKAAGRPGPGGRAQGRAADATPPAQPDGPAGRGRHGRP
jgi:hypothetical protein